MRRALATAASSAAAAPSLPNASTAAPSAAVRVAVLVARNPVVLRPLSSFERAYLQFRDAAILRDPALTKPFAHTHFFKRGSILQQEWLRMHSSSSDSPLPLSDPASPLPVPPLLHASIDQELRTAIDDARKTDSALEERNAALKLHSLDRFLHLPLYLLVDTNTSSSSPTDKSRPRWRLPGTPATIADGEFLHQASNAFCAAERGLRETCGDRMELFAVGQVPVGHVVAQDGQQKTFVMKQVILSGQVHLNPSVASEFAWLTKEEMGAMLEPEYYESIKDIL
ncbi:54S ribosomal protein L17 mitochondrial [Entophlyctis luteolus]|nr:54S ribosomal protein L17 mitochondrial [Entophlyctis luteolus]